MGSSAFSRRSALADRQPASFPRQLLAILVGTTTAIIANVIFYFLVTRMFGITLVAPE